MPETMFFGMKYDDLAGYNDLLAHAEQRLLQLLEGALAYHARHGLTTFVGNFLVPQQNSMGRLWPTTMRAIPSGLCARSTTALPNMSPNIPTFIC